MIDEFHFHTAVLFLETSTHCRKGWIGYLFPSMSKAGHPHFQLYLKYSSQFGRIHELTVLQNQFQEHPPHRLVNKDMAFTILLCVLQQKFC
jgi:hypothetical protein